MFLVLIFFSAREIPGDLLEDIVRNVFIDNPPEPPENQYNFKHSPPALDGQLGVPPIVDKILGANK